jgi:hypothetical protein
VVGHGAAMEAAIAKSMMREGIPMPRMTWTATSLLHPRARSWSTSNLSASPSRETS